MTDANLYTPHTYGRYIYYRKSRKYFIVKRIDNGIVKSAVIRTYEEARQWFLPQDNECVKMT